MWLTYAHKQNLNGFKISEQKVLVSLLSQYGLLLLAQSVLHLLQNVSFLTSVLNTQLAEKYIYIFTKTSSDLNENMQTSKKRDLA